MAKRKGSRRNKLQNADALRKVAAEVANACKACKGKGGHPSNPCKACDGSGQVRIKPL